MKTLKQLFWKWYLDASNELDAMLNSGMIGYADWRYQTEMLVNQFYDCIGIGTR